MTDNQDPVVVVSSNDQVQNQLPNQLQPELQDQQPWQSSVASAAVVDEEIRQPLKMNQPDATPNRNINTQPLNLDEDVATGATQLLTQKPSTKMLIAWLHENFEVRADASISREAVFNEYVKYIEEAGYESMNAASFGKLIRATFPFIQTRRLGVRGQSKYHYHGIGARAGSYLYNLCEMTSGLSVDESGLLRSPGSTENVVYSVGSCSDASLAATSSTDASSSLQHSSQSLLLESGATSMDQIHAPGVQQRHPSSHPLYGGKTRSLAAMDLTEWPSFLLYPFSADHREKLHTWHGLHRQHVAKLCTSLADGTAIHAWPVLLDQFWRQECGASSEFASLLMDPTMVSYLSDCDLYFYSLFLNTVMREWWLPMEPVAMEMIAEMERQLEHWVMEATKEAPEGLRQSKIRMAHAVHLSLHRCRALMSLAERIRPMMREDILITHMISDWRKMDTASVNEYTCWVNQWQEGFIEAVENDILSMFKRRATIENWITWLNSLVQRCVPFPGLQESYDLTAVEYAAKQFMSRFSLFLSQLIRDFTIRTVPAFGSWHALRLFIDEYIWYITAKNMAVLQFNYYRRYPLWIDGLLWHYLDPQRPVVSPVDAAVAPTSEVVHHPAEVTTQTALPPVNQHHMNVPSQNNAGTDLNVHAVPSAMSRNESMDFGSYKPPFENVLGYQADN